MLSFCFLLWLQLSPASSWAKVHFNHLQMLIILLDSFDKYFTDPWLLLPWDISGMLNALSSFNILANLCQRHLSMSGGLPWSWAASFSWQKTTRDSSKHLLLKHWVFQEKQTEPTELQYLFACVSAFMSTPSLISKRPYGHGFIYFSQKQVTSSWLQIPLWCLLSSLAVLTVTHC